MWPFTNPWLQDSRLDDDGADAPEYRVDELATGVVTNLFEVLGDILARRAIVSDGVKGTAAIVDHLRPGCLHQIQKHIDCIDDGSRRIDTAGG